MKMEVANKTLQVEFIEQKTFMLRLIKSFINVNIVNSVPTEEIIYLRLFNFELFIGIKEHTTKSLFHLKNWDHIKRIVIRHVHTHAGKKLFKYKHFEKIFTNYKFTKFIQL